jgi:KDO2-lipid IV(A) lauroyltransferase
VLPLLRLLARLPLPVVHVLGGLLGVLVLPMGSRGRDVRENLRQAGLPGIGIRLRSYWELGKGVAELLPVWLRPMPSLMGLIKEVRGWEHVEAAQAGGNGVLILTPHLGCSELAGIYADTRLRVTALYRKPRQEWVHQLMKQGRERSQGVTVQPDMAGVRTLLKALKNKEAAFILPDQVASKGDGVWADFFGRPAYTPVLFHRLHRSTGAVPLLFFCERLSWGGGYRLWIEALPPLPEDPQAAASQLNARLEALIRRYPAQYLWTYRRYKRPGGAPPPPGEAA